MDIEFVTPINSEDVPAYSEEPWTLVAGSDPIGEIDGEEIFVDASYIVDVNNVPLGSFKEVNSVVNLANAERVVAAVNAVKGIGSDKLTPEVFNKLLTAIWALRSQLIAELTLQVEEPDPVLLTGWLETIVDDLLGLYTLDEKTIEIWENK